MNTKNHRSKSTTANDKPRERDLPRADRKRRQKGGSSRKEPRIIKLANAEDEATGNAFEVSRFAKPLGRTGQERQPREQAFDVNSLRKFLIQKSF